MPRNDGITGHLLDYSYNQIYFIRIDLSRKVNAALLNKLIS